MSDSDTLADNEKQLNRAFAWCCRLLGRREYAAKQLASKLSEKGYPSQLIEKLLPLLQQEGWQSDRRFSESFVRSRIARGQGEIRIRYELEQWIDDRQMIDEAIAEASPDWQSLCEQALLRKRAPRENEVPLSFQERAKLQRFLQYRGFSSRQIRKAMNRLEQARGNQIENDQ